MVSKCKMLKQQILTLFLVLCIRNSSCFINDIWTVVEEIWKFTDIVNEINATDNTAMGFYGLISGENSSQKIAENFQRVRNAFHKIDDVQGFKVDVLQKSLIGVPDNSLRLQEQERIVKSIDFINEEYRQFLINISKDKKNVEVLTNFTYIDLYYTSTEMNRARKKLIPPGKTEFLNIGPVIPIANGSFNIIDSQCDAGQPLQNLLVTLFRMIMTAEMKNYIMLVFSYNFHFIKTDDPQRIQYSRNDEWKSQIRDLRTGMKEQFRKYVQAFSNSLDIMDLAYLRACDPKNNSWIQNESFYEINGFSEFSFFKYPESNCRFTTCYAMWHDYRAECGAQWFDTRTQCDGQILNCVWAQDIEACVLKEGPHKYQWVTSWGNNTVGRDYNNCPKNSSYIIKTADKTDPIKWSSCLCTCVKKYGTIYLGQLTSAKNRNYVITGLRFQLTADNMLWIQPAGGELGANGYVSNSSWIPLPRFIDPNDIGTIDPNWHSFFFDDLRLPGGYALTGIQFVATQRGRDTLIHGYSIEISGVPFNYGTGELNVQPAFEKTSRGQTFVAMQALPFPQVNPIYTSSDNPNRPARRSYNYVELQQTSLEIDLAQSMLPLFDSVPILTSPPSPLGGMGIFHKGSGNHAGFISLRLHSINHMIYIEEFMRMYRRNATKM